MVINLGSPMHLVVFKLKVSFSSKAAEDLLRLGIDRTDLVDNAYLNNKGYDAEGYQEECNRRNVHLHNFPLV